MKGSLPFELYSHIMILRWRLMRQNVFEAELPSRIAIEIETKEWIKAHNILVKNGHRKDRLEILRNSVDTWKKKYDLFTLQIQRFWEQWRVRRMRELKKITSAPEIYREDENDDEIVLDEFVL